ncbi:E3 ubiquitin-protein ligase RNF25 protein [Dioscorea alata]|uniref:E3 ubiquitin-protein ligase RNF25 protein n=1 Tax=Dioscorea alata TaxID=55571 RepID=A0ACB7UG83_DIOAL|nr:E3 ubiquitin-protein ligase RNF25 protein [Dioscorea alata]
MAAEEQEEEVRMEVEAVRAFYGDDCEIIREFPPHLHVHITPNTAENSSQQFVEVVLGILCDAQYPQKPPHLHIVDSKGLDENREKHLITSIENKSQELSSCSMIIKLCQEAVELLTGMNHPEGNCPFCLHPLLVEDQSGNSPPFMKLMSCYHCFHSECIIRWWQWLQDDRKQCDSVIASAGIQKEMKQQQHNCPVCRKLFDAKDIEHILDYAGTNSLQENAAEEMDADERKLLESESEKNRRQKFESLLQLQQENSGLIEPRKEIVVLPGMYLPAPVVPASTAIDSAVEQQLDSASTASEAPDLNIPSNKATTSKHRDMNTRRKNRYHNSRRQQQNVYSNRRQWVKKEMAPSEH